MYSRRSQINGGNIFAYELQNVLRSYNLELSLLDDHVGIHPEKVRRLIQSLHSPRSFPVLNPTEMDLLIATLNLAQADITRLHAAILTTSIERTLVDRINQDAALLATNQIFPILLHALEDESESNQGLGNTRGGPDTNAEDDSSLDEIFGQALAAIDAGEQALSLSSRMSLAKRSSQLRLAITSFTEALQSLDRLPGDMRKRSQWRQWQQDAQRGLSSAQVLLAQL